MNEKIQVNISPNILKDVIWVFSANPDGRVGIGLLRWLSGKEFTWNAGDSGSIPGSGRSLGEGNGNSLQLFLPGKSYRQRNLAGYSPQGLKSVGHNWELNNRAGIISYKTRDYQFHCIFWLKTKNENLYIIHLIHWKVTILRKLAGN